ncbi:hypothetical protein DFH06DRAFT_1337017 [Mycena polygramma]|nr:hypothetical protein DFH06DRAFT_1337017 [Mycena polygramma]
MADFTGGDLLETTRSPPQSAVEIGDTQPDLPHWESKIISCSILVRRPHCKDIPQVIPRVAIEPLLVIIREGASSVRIASLILALRAGLHSRGFLIEDPFLADLINGTSDPSSFINVSTSRVPNFSANTYQNWDSGYQFIGPLSQVNAEVDSILTGHTTVYTSGELISAIVTPDSSQFFSTYRPMSILPESHFILIFTLREDTISSLRPDSANSSMKTTSSLSPLSSFDTDRFSSPHETADYMMNDIDISNLSPSLAAYSALSDLSIPEGMPGLLVATPCSRNTDTETKPDGAYSNGKHTGLTCHSMPSTAPLCLRSSPYPTAPRSRSSSVSMPHKILEFLSTLNPPVGNSAFNNAKFAARHPILADMIRNHAFMVTLLGLCGLDYSEPARTHTFIAPDGQTRVFSVEVLLKACSWKDGTFKNKNSCYQNAKKAAKMEWTAVIPEIGSNDRQKYDDWRGAVFMWSSNGPLSSAVNPSDTSTDDSEKLAFQLTQKALDKLSTTAFRTSYLSELPTP